MNDTPTKGGTLIRIQMVAAEFATSHPTDGMNEVVTVKVFEPILVRVVGVGTTIEVIRRRVLSTFLIMCIL